MSFYRKQLVRPELDPRLAALVTGSAYALLLEGVDCHVMRTGLGTAGLYS